MAAMTMADEQMRELFRSLGRLETAVDEAKAQNVEIKDALRQQNVLAETNKNEAIRARQAKHAEINGRLETLQNLNLETREIALDSSRWIDAVGKPMVARVDNIHDRVTAIEDGKRISAAVQRGEMKTWSLIGGAAVTGGGMVGGIIEYWRYIVDFVRGMHHG